MDIQINKTKYLLDKNIPPECLYSIAPEYSVFADYSLYINKNALTDDEVALASNYINELLRVFALPILRAELPGVFPIGPWALQDQIGSDRRIAVARENGRNTEKVSLGGILASYLPLPLAQKIKPININIVRSNRYDRFSKQTDNDGVTKLSHDAVIFDCLTFNDDWVPPKGKSLHYSYDQQRDMQIESGEVFDFKSELHDFIYAYILRNECYDLNKIRDLTDILPKKHSDWGVFRGVNFANFKNGLTNLHDLHQTIKLNKSSYSLMWYDSVLAVVKDIRSRVFIPQINNLLGNLLDSQNGKGIVHPLIDNLITERRGPVIVDELGIELNSMHSRGKLLRKNLGHIQLVASKDVENFSSSFKATILNNSLNDYMNNMNVVTHGFICQLERIQPIVSSKVLSHKDAFGEIKIEELELHPNLSGCQPKFGANLQLVDNMLRIYPATNDVAFTHIVKPIAIHSTHGSFYPIAEWLSLKAATESGCRTSTFSLFTFDRAVTTEPESEAIELAVSEGLNLFGDTSYLDDEIEALKHDWSNTFKTVLISERFDIGNEQDHSKKICLDLCQLMGLSCLNDIQVKYSSTFDEVADLIKSYCEKFGTWENERYELFRQGVISWLLMDSDLHLKNISVMYSEKIDETSGETKAWFGMSPVYDRVSLAGFTGGWKKDFTLPVSGKRVLSKEDWISFAENKLDIPREKSFQIIHSMANAVMYSVKSSLNYLVENNSFASASHVATLKLYARDLKSELYQHITKQGNVELEMAEAEFMEPPTVTPGLSVVAKSL